MTFNRVKLKWTVLFGIISLLFLMTSGLGASPSIDINKSLTVDSVINVSTSLDELARNEYLNQLVDAKTRQSGKVYWHVMSASSAFDPRTNKNYLFERVFYTKKDSLGHRSEVMRSFIVMTVWQADWSSRVPGVSLKVIELTGRIYLEARQYEGPEDARAVYDETKQRVVITFNMLTTGQTGREDRQMYQMFIVPGEKFAISPLIQLFHETGKRNLMEKNWLPLFWRGQLMYVYSLQPLRVIQCFLVKGLGNDIDGVKGRKAVCQVKFGGPAVGVDAPQTGNLRCGSNWLEYQSGIYVSIGRTRLVAPPCKSAIYRPHLLLLDLRNETQGRIIYASEPLIMMDKILFGMYTRIMMPRIVPKRCDRHSVLTPGSLTRLENGSVDLAVSINDDVNVIVRLGGFDRTVQTILANTTTNDPADPITLAELQMRAYILNTFSRKDPKSTGIQIQQISNPKELFELVAAEEADGQVRIAGLKRVGGGGGGGSISAMGVGDQPYLDEEEEEDGDEDEDLVENDPALWSLLPATPLSQQPQQQLKQSNSLSSPTVRGKKRLNYCRAKFHPKAFDKSRGPDFVVLVNNQQQSAK